MSLFVETLFLLCGFSCLCMISKKRYIHCNPYIPQLVTDKLLATFPPWTPSLFITRGSLLYAFWKRTQQKIINHISIYHNANISVACSFYAGKSLHPLKLVFCLIKIQLCIYTNGLQKLIKCVMFTTLCFAIKTNIMSRCNFLCRSMFMQKPVGGGGGGGIG